jgi:hypothetical protein
MKKLTLNLDALRVESYETGGDRRGAARAPLLSHPARR